jgi:hypothetical protein
VSRYIYNNEEYYGSEGVSKLTVATHGLCASLNKYVLCNKLDHLCGACQLVKLDDSPRVAAEISSKNFVIIFLEQYESTVSEIMCIN